MAKESGGSHHGHVLLLGRRSLSRMHRQRLLPSLLLVLFPQPSVVVGRHLAGKTLSFASISDQAIALRAKSVILACWSLHSMAKSGSCEHGSKCVFRHQSAQQAAVPAVPAAKQSPKAKPKPKPKAKKQVGARISVLGHLCHVAPVHPRWVTGCEAFLGVQDAGGDSCRSDVPKKSVPFDSEVLATYEHRLLHPSSYKHSLGHAKGRAMNPQSKSKSWRRYLHEIRKQHGREEHRQRLRAWNQYRAAHNYAGTWDEVKHAFFVYAAVGHDRSYIVDSGSSLHLMPMETLTADERAAIRLGEPVTLNTANDQVEATCVTDVYVIQLDLFVEAYILQGVPPVLSLGLLVTEHGIKYS